MATFHVKSPNGNQYDIPLPIEASSLIAGSVIAYAGSNTPTGYLLCDGSAVSRTTYAALFEAIGTTYGSGDGSTTFNIPNMIDRFIHGSSTSGEYLGPGLPDIHAVFSTHGYSIENYQYLLYNIGGALVINSVSGGPSACSMTGSWGVDVNYGFYASRFNSIYGASGSVQPPALKMRYIIKY